MLRAALIAIFLLVPISTHANAQSNSGSVSGYVLDQNSAAIPGATVSLKCDDPTIFRRMTTDTRGRFRFDNIPAQVCTLTVFAEGFSKASREADPARGAAVEINITMAPSAIAETVFVTAGHILGLPESVERIPGSVDYIDSRTLETSRAFTSNEVLRKVAGVSARDEEGFGLRPNISIRGVNPTRSSKILFLEDGIPVAFAPYGDNASYYHPPIDRFKSIEILKGSGQILYGPSTVGGVINYITPEPPGDPSGSITLIGGSRSFFNGLINYGGTWGKTGLLFNFLRKQGEGARENVKSGIYDFNFKAVQALGTSQALTLRFNIYNENSNVTYSGLRQDEYLANPRQNPFRNDFFYGDRIGASATHAFVFSPGVVLTTNVYYAYFKRHWWRQSSNSNQRPNDATDPGCGGMANLNTTCGNEGRLRRYHTFGVDPRIRIAWKFMNVSSETDLGFRAHFERQERQQQNGDTPTARSGVIVENNQRKNQAYSGFIQNRFSFGRITVTPGLRIEHIEYARTNGLANAGAGVAGFTSLTQLIPGIGASYNPSDRFTVFAGVHKGFAPPRTEDIINNTTGGSIDLDPESSWNYEIGFRSNLLAGLKIDATFFRMNYENQIVPASLAGGVGSTLTNGGSTLHQGFEISGKVDAGALFKRQTNFYLRAAYTYLPVAKFTGIRSSNVAGFSSVSVTGNRLPYAPRQLLTAEVGYSHPGGIDALLESVYVSSQFGDDLNTINPSPDGQRGVIPSHVVWNATANHNVERIRSTFFITVKNLFDKAYIADRSRGILPGTPRLLQVGVKFRF